MASQIALHKDLKDPFVIVDYEQQKDFLSSNTKWLSNHFEFGKILVFDNLNFSNLQYFLDQPGKWFPDWIPPIFGHRIQKPLNAEHTLRTLYDGKDDDILEFQRQSAVYQDEWKILVCKLFPFYKWDLFEFSYRFNHMDLGNLHLDVPDKAYEGHQFRWFINMDKRPRIIAIGPTIFELAQMFWSEKKLYQLENLPPHEFVGKLRQLVLDQTIYKERELPRHYLTLDPGALWLAHSSYISHGLVYGRKTACMEAHIAPDTMLNPMRHFNTMIRQLQKNHPSSIDSEYVGSI